MTSLAKITCWALYIATTLVSSSSVVITGYANSDCSGSSDSFDWVADGQTCNSFAGTYIRGTCSTSDTSAVWQVYQNAGCTGVSAPFTIPFDQCIPAQGGGSGKFTCSGLTAGAIAGIVIGVLLAIGLIAGCIWHRRKQQHIAANATNFHLVAGEVVVHTS